MYSDDFWRVFSSVYTERSGVIDRVLRACRDVYVSDKDLRKKFEVSTRKMRKTTLDAAGDFLSHIMHEVDIPMGHFNLPCDTTCIKFRFVNPLWAWVTATNVLLKDGHKINFKPRVMIHEKTNERLYGAGVSFGDCLKFARARTPRRGKPALFGISFDGGDSGISDRNAYPICVSTLNFDGADPKQCGMCLICVSNICASYVSIIYVSRMCVSYMCLIHVGLVGFIPKLEVPASFQEAKNQQFLAARSYLVQQCVGAILDELENVSRNGFSAYVGGVLMTLHPFLVAVRVDTKERVNYFGLKSDRYDTHI